MGENNDIRSRSGAASVFGSAAVEQAEAFEFLVPKGGKRKADILKSSTKPVVQLVDETAIPDNLKSHARWLGWCWKRNAARSK